uniref:t-SNARE coiled-coil homology domain-containing protein n=1 Tax=Oryza punctata TaxID=4537 RepID=A0A0E0JMJ4_ORYPU
MKQDEGLDIIGKGLETLKNMASDMNEELDRQVPLMDEIEQKADRANAGLKNTNARLKETVLQIIYVGSAEDENYDQQLESVLVGPVNVGTYRFVLQADPPDPSKIREEDIIGVTVLLLTCSYMGQEFIRVGYYVNNDYDDEQLREEPPAKLLIDRVQRNILPYWQASPESPSFPSISILKPVQAQDKSSSSNHILVHLKVIQTKVASPTLINDPGWKTRSIFFQPGCLLG